MNAQDSHCAEIIVGYELVRVFPFLQVIECEKLFHFLPTLRIGRLDLNNPSSLSAISNKNGLLIQSNYNRTEYMCGPPCV